MSQQECLDYSQQEKTILQVAKQERLGVTEIEGEREREKEEGRKTVGFKGNEAIDCGHYVIFMSVSLIQ